MKGTKVDGSWSGFADDLFIKDKVPENTAESAKDIIMDNAESLDAALAEDKYKQNLRKLEIVPSVHRYGEQRRLTALIPLERCWAEPGTLEADSPVTRAIGRKQSADCKRWLRGFWFARSPWSHKGLIFMSRIGSAAVAGLDAYAASPEPAGQESMSIITCAIEGKSIRNCCER